MDPEQPLARAFLERRVARATRAGESLFPAPPDLEALLAHAISQARAPWPAVHVDPIRFVTHLAEQLPLGDDLDAGIAALNLPGLCLACACRDGDEAAIATLDSFVRDCDGSLSRMAGGRSFADDVKQQVRAKLLVAEPGHVPKIAEYAGRGDLRSFVRVLVMRQALSFLRKARREVALDEDLRGRAELGFARDPELDHLRETYEVEFTRAFGDAVCALTSEERNLLRFHYLDGLSIDHIGAIYGIHRVSAARRLTRVRQALVTKTRALLRERMRLRTGELESVLRLIESGVDISIRRALRDASEA